MSIRESQAVRKAATVEAENSRGPSYVLASKESFGFFDDVEDATWQLYQEKARNETIYMNPNNPNAGLDTDPALWLLNNVDPIFTCPHLRRVGGHGDGPKWTCDPHRLKKKSDCLIYSFGSSGEYSFEDGLYELFKDENNTNPCEIHVFDPDPKYARANDPQTKNIHYHAWGLKSSYEASAAWGGFEFLSIQDTMKSLGHSSRRIDIFKIDCELCEYSTYKDWLNPSVDIRNILIETHTTNDRAVQEGSKFYDRFLDQGFVPYSKEANTHPGAQPFGLFFEWGFIRLHKDFLGRTTSL